MHKQLIPSSLSVILLIAGYSTTDSMKSKDSMAKARTRGMLKKGEVHDMGGLKSMVKTEM